MDKLFVATCVFVSAELGSFYILTGVNKTLRFNRYFISIIFLIK